MAEDGNFVELGAIGLRIDQLENTVRELQKELKQQKEAASNGGQGGGGLTLEQVKKMTPEQINKRWEEVRKFLAGGK